MLGGHSVGITEWQHVIDAVNATGSKVTLTKTKKEVVQQKGCVCTMGRGVNIMHSSCVYKFLHIIFFLKRSTRLVFSHAIHHIRKPRHSSSVWFICIAPFKSTITTCLSSKQTFFKPQC